MKTICCATSLTYLQSSDAQTIIEEEGYISLTSRTYSAYSVPETLPETTELSVGGSTSVQPLMSQLAYAYEELLGRIRLKNKICRGGLKIQPAFCL